MPSFKSFFLAAIKVFALLLIYLIAYVHGLRDGSSNNPPNPNALFVKHLKDVAPNKEIAINPTTSLCGFSRAKLYALRTKMVLQHPELVLGTYKPSQAVFGQIVDGKPWWGIIGQFFYGSGKYSPTGNSEESRFIVNPFLLASPEFFGFTFYNHGKFRWRNDITDKLLKDDHFPFYCQPYNLRWAPESASAEVTYDVSSYMKWLNKYAAKPLTVGNNATFELIDYNARDLGFNYVFIPLDKCMNIKNDYGELKGPLELRHFIHCGGSCGYPGGCNNMSPAVPQTDNLRISKLPARLKLLFWRHQPDNINTAADMTFFINFK